MSQVRITDERLEAALRESTDTVTVHGADGRIMGLFTPIDSAALQPRISEEELERRLADTTSPGYSTTEVLAKLRAL